MTSKMKTQSAAWKALEAITKRFASLEGRKPGAIQFQLTGGESAEFALEVDERRQVKQIAGKSRLKPSILISGDEKQIRMVLEGKREATRAFLGGGIQVRGDIRYLERVLQELKLLKPAD